MNSYEFYILVVLIVSFVFYKIFKKRSSAFYRRDVSKNEDIVFDCKEIQFFTVSKNQNGAYVFKIFFKNGESLGFECALKDNAAKLKYEIFSKM